MTEKPVRKLVLHARSPQHLPGSRDVLSAALVELGLIGDPLANGDMAFHSGDRFLDLVTFLGCSPDVRLEPGNDQQSASGEFCHVRFPPWTDTPRLRVGAMSKPPRCPACRKDVQDWQQQLDAGADQWACGNCGETVTLETLNWRQSAGYSRWFVEIWHVYPHEAVPSEALIARLEALCGGSCDFFYE